MVTEQAYERACVSSEQHGAIRAGLRTLATLRSALDIIDDAYRSATHTACSTDAILLLVSGDNSG